MAGLDIRPHSKRLSAAAAVVLIAVAGGGFAAGLARQFQPTGASPFPAGTDRSLRVQMADAIPEATPAPDLQVAVREPPLRRPAPVKADPDADVAAPAAPATAADASAAVPAPPPAAPSAPLADNDTPPT